MAARLRGDKNQFWDNAATGAGGFSAVVDIGRSVNQLQIFATVSGATTLTVQVAHEGDITSEGIIPEGPISTWFDLYYMNTSTPVTLVITGALSWSLIIPDIAFTHCRLASSANVTATAGWQAVGD